MPSVSPKDHADQPRLLHPILLRIPKTVRFLLCGAASNILFLLSLSFAISTFQHQYPHSTIYSASSLLYMPVGHALTCLLVYGWPKPYLPSLIGTAPIGLSCTVIGTALTGFLDKIQFDRTVQGYLELLPFLMPMKKSDEETDEGSGTYSSLIVLIVTGLFAYFATDYVMGSGSGKAKNEKNE